MITACFCLLFFLTPLVMAPWTYELFEFNKIMLTFFLAAVIMAAWLVKMILAKKFIFRHTFWDWPLVIFLATQFLSFLVSIDQGTSWWGYYGRFNGGLLSLIVYAFLYWAWVSNLSLHSRRYVLHSLLAGATVAAGYGIAQHYGIDDQLWVQDVKNRVFSTLGQPNWLAAYLTAILPLAWFFTISKSKSPLPYFLSLIFTLCLLFTKSRSGLIGFGTAFAIFWGLNLWQQRRKVLKPFLLISSSLILITVLTKIPASRVDQVNQVDQAAPILISESGEIRKVVWRGALEIWRHYPILGTGPETFAYAYYWFRPREHNDLSEWDFLYNKAHNEYLNFAANTGTVGLTGYLILIVSFVIWSFTKIINLQRSLKIRKLPARRIGGKIENYFNIALLAGFASILVTNFFGFSVVPVASLFFLLPALAAVDAKPQTPLGNIAQHPRGVFIQKFLIIFVVTLLLAISYQLSTIWLADTRFAKAQKLSQAGQYEAALDLLQLAVKAQPHQPLYQDALATAAAGLNATELAIDFSNQAVTASPYNLNFWKNRTKMFYQLAKNDPQYQQAAINALLHASQLAPTDAKIRYNLAILYFATDQSEAAFKALQEALILKPNYQEAKEILESF